MWVATSRLVNGAVLTRPVELVPIDEIEVASSKDGRPLLLGDFDGVLSPLERHGDNRRGWSQYVELDLLEHVPGVMKVTVAIGAVASIARLPVQPMSLSSRYDTTQSSIDYAFRALRLRDLPAWQILDAHRKQEDLMNYQPSRPVSLPVTPTHYKAMAVFRLIDRIARQPENDRRSIVWLDDELAIQPDLEKVISDYASRQGVELKMPRIDRTAGVTPEQLREVAKHCHDKGLKVPKDWLVGAKRASKSVAEPASSPERRRSLQRAGSYPRRRQAVLEAPGSDRHSEVATQERPAADVVPRYADVTHHGEAAPAAARPGGQQAGEHSEPDRSVPVGQGQSTKDVGHAPAVSTASATDSGQRVLSALPQRPALNAAAPVVMPASHRIGAVVSAAQHKRPEAQPAAVVQPEEPSRKETAPASVPAAPPVLGAPGRQAAGAFKAVETPESTAVVSPSQQQPLPTRDVEAEANRTTAAKSLKAILVAEGPTR